MASVHIKVKGSTAIAQINCFSVNKSPNQNKTHIVEIKTVTLPSRVLKKRFLVNRAYVLYFIHPNLTPIGSANPSPIIAKHTTSNPISAQKIPK